MLISFVSGIVGILINTIIIHMLLTRRKSRLYCILLFIFLICFLSTLIIFVAKSPYGETPLGKYIVFLLTACIFIYNYIVFEESLVKKLFAMMSIWLLSVVFILIGLYILKTITSLNQTAYSEKSITLLRIILELIMRSVHFILFITIRKIYMYYLHFINDRTIFFMSLYAFIGVLYSYENYRSDVVTYVYININFRNLLFFISFVILGYINVCIAIMSTNKSIMLDNNIKMIESQIKLQTENYKSLVEFTEDQAKLKHDLRHHMMAVKGILENGDLNSALLYIQQFNQNEMLKDIPVLCMNLAADSLIKYYMSIAINKCIDFQTKLNIPVDININTIDLSVILGNCIENAINACDKLCGGEKRYIELKSDIVGKQFIIQIKNSFNGIIRKDGYLFVSSSHEGVGIGITNIIATSKKYNGEVDIQYNDNEFRVSIILSI